MNSFGNKLIYPSVSLKYFNTIYSFKSMLMFFISERFYKNYKNLCKTLGECFFLIINILNLLGPAF